MKIYIQYISALHIDCIDDIKRQITSTIKVLRDEYQFNPGHFSEDGSIDVEDYALFPIFYEDDCNSTRLLDKNRCHSYKLSKPRYIIKYVWELDDIKSPVDSDNLAYEVLCLDKYYKQLQNVSTRGFTFIGRYDTVEDTFKLNCENNDKG